MARTLYVGSKRYAMFAPVTTRFTTYGVELDGAARDAADEPASRP